MLFHYATVHPSPVLLQPLFALYAVIPPSPSTAYIFTACDMSSESSSPAVPKPPKGTPFKINADGKDRYASLRSQGLQKREDYCDEMLGLIMGPLEVTEYLEEFVPIKEGQTFPSAPRVTFDAVPLEAKKPLEKDMYQPLVWSTITL